MQYDMFRGHTPQAQQSSRGLGKDLRPVDWDKAKQSSSWVIFDANKVAVTATTAVPKTDLGLPADKAEAWRQEHAITVFGTNCPSPMPQFDMLTMMPPFIQKKFEVQGFKEPTCIQSQSWPILFQHRDLVGIAKTGSGKTLAFIVPAIAHIAQQQQLRPGDGPICLVLAPTRELAQQIEVETQKIIPSTMKCTCIYGGAPKGAQLQVLRQGVHILVATPGRLIDLLQIQRLSLLRVTYLVLDEADRMLDMGFEPQVRTICSQVRPDRQTLMFSATWPKEIQNLASSFQRDFIRIHVGSTMLLANPDVTQHFVHCTEDGKFFELKKLLQLHNTRRVLVFCKTKRTADFLERQLRGQGVDAMAIHGDKEQKQREFILERFRRESKLVVVATDVAARGLDIKQLEVVVNFDFPMQVDDYVHRIGRTGRAGAKGDSYTFMTKKEAQITPAIVRELLRIVQQAKQVVPEFLSTWADELKYSAVRRSRDAGFGRFQRKGPQLSDYSHHNRPSFNAHGGGGTSGGAPYFGLSEGGGSNGFGSKVVRFRDDDEVDHSSKAARKE